MEEEFKVEMLLPRLSPAEYKTGDNVVVQCQVTAPHITPNTMMMSKNGAPLPVALSPTLNEGEYLLTYHGDGKLNFHIIHTYSF